MKSKKILLTGFEAFGGDNRNPSTEIASFIMNKYPEVDILILPVEYEKAFLMATEKLKQRNYDLLIMLGLAKSRVNFEIEHCAVNFSNSAMADNSGTQYLNKKIIEGASDFYFANSKYLNLELENLEHSFHAGNFVCNQLYFKILHENILESVFIHVPWSEDENVQKSFNIKFLDIFNNCIKLV